MVGFSRFFEGLEPIRKNHIDKSYVHAASLLVHVEMLRTYGYRGVPKKPKFHLKRTYCYERRIEHHVKGSRK